MSNLTDHNKAISDIDRILGFLESEQEEEPVKHVKSKERLYWENQVDMLALSEGRQMVLTNTGWIGSMTIAKRWGAEVIYASPIDSTIDSASVSDKISVGVDDSGN